MRCYRLRILKLLSSFSQPCYGPQVSSNLGWQSYQLPQWSCIMVFKKNCLRSMDWCGGHWLAECLLIIVEWLHRAAFQATCILRSTKLWLQATDYKASKILRVRDWLSKIKSDSSHPKQLFSYPRTRTLISSMFYRNQLGDRGRSIVVCKRSLSVRGHCSLSVYCEY